MTNRELSRAICSELSAAGIPRKAYSIRVQTATYDVCADIALKDLTIGLDRVRSIVSRFEHVRWDDRVGEILAGANTFVNVAYDRDELNAAAEVYSNRAMIILTGVKIDGAVVAHHRRNGHHAELVYFPSEHLMMARDAKTGCFYRDRHIAVGPYDTACALALFSARGRFS